MQQPDHVPVPSSSRLGKKYPILHERLHPSKLRTHVFPVRSVFQPLRPSLPTHVDLRPRCPPVYNQLELGACTACALVAAVQVLHPTFMGSRLFLYYNERVKDGDVPDDAGSTLSQGVQCLADKGLCAESLWPYDIARFAESPPEEAYSEGLNHRVPGHAHVVPTATQMMACLAAGHPFVVGIMVYQSFESDEVAATGRVPMPAQGEACLGGHAVLVVGYDARAKTFLVRNSWGPDWGDGGYFHLPFAYMVDQHLASDLWRLSD